MLQSTFSKAAMAVAGGAVAAMSVAGPATAVETTTPAAPVKTGVESPLPKLGGYGKVYWGKVIARTGLKVRSGPSQHHKWVGSLKYGEVIKIRCKVNGQWIDGNPRWYKLYDGNYMWASARYIKNIGAAPHYCHHR
ncbi:SH3 domain-containing protein [Streptomyces sp. TR06-5]|uniref:SH3 domain-containing protein n=1 Tax=unclassified Streptomyces TaxID=2593676 RepID=UPI00399FE267